MLKITCPECGKELKIPEQYLGRLGKCNHCGKKIQVLVSPPKFSKEVYEMEEEETEKPLLPSIAISPTKSNQESISSAFEPFTFNDSHEVGNIQDSVPQQVNESNVADMLGQLGKSMTGCGCYVLTLPFVIVMLVLSYNLLFAPSNSDTQKQAKKQSPRTAEPSMPAASRPNISTDRVDLDGLYQIDNLLDVASYYQVSGEITLMPEFEPVGYENTLSAIAGVRKVSGQSSWILIRGLKFKNTTPWYQVHVFDLSGSQIGSGWINAVSLLGQKVTKHSLNTNLIVPNQSSDTPSEYNPHPQNFYIPQTTTSLGMSTDMVYISNTGGKYHRADCRTLKGKNKYPFSMEEARRRGYEPCKVCNPRR